MANKFDELLGQFDRGEPSKKEKREDIHTDLDCVIDTLSHIRRNSEFEKVDVLIINKAIELIDSVAWKYEEDK